MTIRSPVDFEWDANRTTVGGPEEVRGMNDSRRQRETFTQTSHKAVKSMLMSRQPFEASPSIEVIAATMTRPCSVAETPIGAAPGNKAKLVT